jgi:MULE transposase domain
MPLVLFVGVNHHGQSILFAYSFVSREDDVSYKWVFSKFVKCMGILKPGAILTDQCKSIENGVRDSLPGIVHHFCSWHITQKLPMRCGGTTYKDVLTDLVKIVVYDSLAPADFEKKNWDILMVEIGYNDDAWF